MERRLAGILVADVGGLLVPHGRGIPMIRLIFALAVFLALTGTARAGGPEYCKQRLSAHHAGKLDLAIK